MPKRQWPLLVAIVLGLAVAGVSAYFLLNFAADYQEFTQIVVPKKEIPAFSQLTQDNLGIKKVPIGSVGSNVVVEPSQVLGKITTVPLYTGEQIRLERLIKEELADTSRQNVSVNINLTRSIGGIVSPGDVVDVYWIVDEGTPGAVLATDSRVLALLDGQGNNLSMGSNSLLDQVNPTQLEQAGLPAIVILAVKPDEVPQVIRGSADQSGGIVLVKKLKEGGNVVSTGNSEISQNPEGTGEPTTNR
ncbi:MAG: Flp pilus assembly protein CpaB [Bacillota bacterium]